MTFALALLIGDSAVRGQCDHFAESNSLEATALAPLHDLRQQRQRDAHGDLCKHRLRLDFQHIRAGGLSGTA
jgi:hypothetical protein